MRILYVTTIAASMNAFFKPHIEMLVKEGHQVDVACNDKDWPISSFFEDIGCTFRRIDFSRVPLSKDNVIAYRQLKNVIKEGNYDLVHCHTPNAAVITRLVCRPFRKKTGLRVFYTAHGFHFYKGAPTLNWLVFYPVEKLCSRFTDKLITINQEDYQLAKAKFHAGEVHYVPGVGIDLEKFGNVCVDRAAKRREIGVPEGACLLLSVGELNENKNHQTVLKAMAKQDNANMHYAIAGVGDKHDQLLVLAESLGLSDRLHLLGYRQDVAELYHCADVFCFPSLREGLGLAAIEAMACGLPVVAADNRGTRSFVVDGENGMLCSADSTEQFGQAIMCLVGDRNLREKFAAAGLRTASIFSKENKLARMLEIYSGSVC